MNTISVITRIKQELDDQGIFYTDEDVFDSLQDAYDEVALRTQCIEKTVSIPFPTTPYWKVTDDVADYYRPFGIYDPNQNLFMEPTSFKILESIDDEWELKTGTPWYFVPVDFHYIAFYFHYATVPSQNMYLMYSATAPDFTSSNTMDIPSNYQKVLINYVVNDLLDQSLEFKKSSMLYKEYLIDVAKMKAELGKRNNSDRIRQMMVQINANMD